MNGRYFLRIRRYFLRIRGSTLGPLRADQVRQLLQRGNIGPLHEASTDRTTWRQLQDCSEFAAFAPRAAGIAEGSHEEGSQQGLCSTRHRNS